MMGDIFIYGGIGTDIRNGEISSDNVRAQIDQNKNADELVVHIISPGGDVFEGEAIYNALKNSGKKITTQIEGTCASIATLIAGAGQKVVMNKTARFMIHNPMVTGFDKAADSRMLRSVAQQLDQIKGLLINVWEKKPSIKINKEKLWELYDNETWLTAEQAEQMGFIDESVDAIKAVATVDLTKFLNQMKQETVFQNLMKRFQNLLSSTIIKNEAKETLQDGTVIVVLTEDGDFTGKQVMYESGEPLPAGEHTLASGKVIEVDGNSVITEVKEGAEASNKEEDMKLKEENESLKARLAEAQAKLTENEGKLNEATAQVISAKADTVKFQNKVTNLEKDFIKLKEEAEKAFGEDSTKHKGPVFKNMDNPAKDFDPMGEEVKLHLQGRNRI